MKSIDVFKGIKIVHPELGNGKVIEGVVQTELNKFEIYQDRKFSKLVIEFEKDVPSSYFNKDGKILTLDDTIDPEDLLIKDFLKDCGYFYPYGIFGGSDIFVDKDGYIERFCLFQASGCFAGAPPYEMLIDDLIPFNDEEFGKQWCAKKNRKTDLPFYLGKIKVKCTDSGKRWTDEELLKEGIQPLEENLVDVQIAQGEEK